MDEKVKELERKIFELEKESFVHYELLKEIHYELFKIRVNKTVLNWLAISYVINIIINYFWGK